LAALDVTRTRHLLQKFDFRTLFIEELGWDHHPASLEVPVDGQTLVLTSVAQKRGMVVLLCAPFADGRMPDYAMRRKIERHVAKSVFQHLIIYTDTDNTTQIWQWVKRETGKPAACREHTYHKSQSGDALIQKLQLISFTLEEEERLSHLDVTGRARAAFDVERVTKRFYDRFKAEHAAFLEFLKGIPDAEMERWYISVMLNRLMFIYFIQKKGFLDNNIDYLQTKLAQGKEHGADRFYKDFLCPLFFEGFAKKESERSTATNRLLGEVPYLNGGLFLRHQIEELHGQRIQIADAAFEKLFAFFDQYQWHLDERPLRADNEINPDVLGYIFEKYINQKQMGAYYTKEDITGYISKNTVIPFLFDQARKKCKIAFEGEQSIWRLLQADPDRYIYDAVKKGVKLPIPPEIAAGLDDVSKRTEWNKPAPSDYALPTEIWREVVARRKRYEEVRTKLVTGEIRDINDHITYNLDIRQFAQDVIENCEGPELLRAFYHAIEKVTVLDPTCGSGAFLFAALNILEPLYEACLDRMQVFLEELARSGERHRPEKFSDFRKVLERVAHHPNRRYFILKSIIVNNLFGVDIMDEAVEICKLRLFLKLVAQVERVEGIEPLPDIDFNIRAGNTLVGFATYEDVKRAISLDENSGQYKMHQMLSGDAMAHIEERAQDVDSMFGLFRQQQTEVGAEVTPADKQELRNRLKTLEDELNRYLAGEYGVVVTKHAAYEKWRTAHKPFHWFIEFYGILKQGGFDVVIGNPPYFDLRNLHGYSVKGFTTLATRNLYSLILERCQCLVSVRGQQGYIVPVSSIATEGYSELQQILSRRRLIFSSFDDRPSHLFDGLDKNTLSILLLSHKTSQFNALSSRLSRWSANERNSLFVRLQYHMTPKPELQGCLPKIGSAIEAGIWRKLFSRDKPLASFYASKSKYIIYYSRKVNAFLQVLDFVPQVRDSTGNLRPPSEFKEVRFPSRNQAAALFCCFNSTLFRWFMDVVSDGSHVNRREVDNFPFNPVQASSDFPELENLAKCLSNNLQQTSLRRTMKYQHDTLTVQCIIPKYSKEIIDEIDRVLAKHYGFTDEELDFIINYDIKYRMGQNAGEDE
jgi:hypothetical protein